MAGVHESAAVPEASSATAASGTWAGPPLTPRTRRLALGMGYVTSSDESSSGETPTEESPGEAEEYSGHSPEVEQGQCPFCKGEHYSRAGVPCECEVLHSEVQVAWDWETEAREEREQQEQPQEQEKEKEKEKKKK